MAHIDNEFNERFSNQQLPNDNFDAEGLWDAISEDLGDKQPDASGASDAMLGKNWMTKLILLSIIL